MTASGTTAVDREPSDPVDCCIVGAGPAGALIANELAATGHAVVVLDAGPRFDRRVVDLPPADRDALLDQMSVDVADPDPDGVDRERVRYYVVNELLFALYATPTGGKLVGIENPQGYPGGTASYQRGPKS